MLIYIVFLSIHQNNKKCEPKLLVRICGGTNKVQIELKINKKLLLKFYQSLNKNACVLRVFLLSSQSLLQIFYCYDILAM